MGNRDEQGTKGCHAEPGQKLSPGIDREVLDHIEDICRILRQRTGHDFSLYRQATLGRRTRRRMQVLHIESPRDYLDQLERDPPEADHLLQELLIGVTQFFRNPEAFDSLVAHAVPAMCAARAGDAPLRIWVPGCASGEEAYSLAILVDEYLVAAKIHRACQIFATDIDGESLREARRAVYPESSLTEVSLERLERYFIREANGYRVSPKLREMCTFSVQNLVRDPPFSSLDLISCRNVLIYLQPQAQNRVIELFHYALRPGGILFLGLSEGLAASADLCDVVDKTHRIFRRRDVAARPAVRVASTHWTASGRASQAAEVGSAHGVGAEVLSEAFARILIDEFAPSSVLVNGRGDILFMAGRMGRYTNPGFAAPSNNLLDQTHGLLRRELRAVLARTVAENRRIVRDGVRVETEEGLICLRISARPMSGVSGDAGLYAVVLQEREVVLSPDGQQEEEAFPEPQLVEQLERELREMREDLQSTVEELEASNEELKSSNEELQSANEELQSSQEELHSVNQELEDVNTRLEANVQDLRAANDDLSNLFLNAEVAILFLNHELRITRFTPAAASLFRLRDGDLGRPLADLSARFAGLDLVGDAQQALVTGVGIEREAQSVADNASYLVRSSAYLTGDRNVRGAVLTFTDVTALKRAQSEMARIASFPERNPNPIVEIDLSGRISYQNPAAAALFPDLVARGRTHPWLDNIEAVARLFLDGKERTQTREIQTHGSLYQQVIHFLPDLGTVRIYGLDITARRQAEIDLRHERDFLDRVMEASPVGIVTFDKLGVITHANPRALAILGVSKEETLRRAFDAPAWPVTDYDGNPVPEQSLAFHRVSQLREMVTDLRRAIARPDGNRTYLSINAAPILGPGQEFDGAVVGLQDVTTTHLAQLALAQSEKKYRQLFENLTVGFALHEMIYDDSGRAVDYRFLELNPAFERLTGLPRGQAVGRTVKELVPNLEQHWIDTYAKVVESGQPVSYENFAKDLGRHFEVWAFCPAPKQFATIFTDISARKRAEEVLLQQQKLETVGVLAGGIAHDFNNLLAGLFGFVQLAQASSPQGTETRKHLDSAMEVYQRSRTLAQQLLTFSKGGAPVREIVDLKPMVRQAVTFALSGANVKALFDIADDLWPCAVDLQQLSQVIDNVVINARQAMPRGGTISVEAKNERRPPGVGRLGSTGSPGREVRISIRDSGVGIQPENLPRIFDPFFSTKSSGSGLGLATAYSIVRKHDGRIEVESQLGKGSTFHIVLPASSEAAQRPAPMTSSPETTRPVRILAMDDEKTVLDVLTAVLKRLGHSVVCVPDGQTAIEQYRLAMESSEPFDVVILDLTVPGGMGGCETIARLRALNDRVKGIVSSGYADDPVLSDPVAFGFRGRLKKPCTLDDIRRALEEVIASD
jgi:two-component system, chemotaxis family, CheB/CheR fusion protein